MHRRVPGTQLPIPTPCSGALFVGIAMATRRATRDARHRRARAQCHRSFRLVVSTCITSASGVSVHELRHCDQGNFFRFHRNREMLSWNVLALWYIFRSRVDWFWFWMGDGTGEDFFTSSLDIDGYKLIA